MVGADNRSSDYVKTGVDVSPDVGLRKTMSEENSEEQGGGLLRFCFCW